MNALKKVLTHLVVDCSDWWDFTLESTDSATEMTIAIRRDAEELRAGASSPVTLVVSASSPSKRRRATAMEDVEFDEGWTNNLASTPSTSPTVA